MKQKTLLIIVIFSLIQSSGFAQKKEIIAKMATHFQIKKNNDTIDFIVLDTLITEKKPILLYCQGSLPRPLFFNHPKWGTLPLGGDADYFNLDSIKKHYHLVIISMPKTPVISEYSNLNKNYSYIPDSTNNKEFSKSYLKANYLQNYVDRGLAVLKYLRKQSWVDNSRLLISGHSQGTKVATKIAIQNKRVTALGLFSANPFGRFDTSIRTTRLEAELGRVSWEEADSTMTKIYSNYEKNYDSDYIKDNEWVAPFNTFNEQYLDDWLKLKIPIYLTYGTEDRIADLCDIVPLFFIQEQKNNLTIKRQLYLDHSFYFIEKDGKPNRSKKMFPKVMNEFIDWSLNK